MTYEDFCKEYPFRYESEVKWGEMDALQHVNNIYYFRYFECSRMMFWDRLKEETQGKVPATVGPILGATSCRFRRPLFYPDKILIGARVVTLADDRFTLGHGIWCFRENALAAEGDGIIVSFDYVLKKKIPLPEAWKAFINSSSLKNA